jgi:AcrR family transcriptional regulator
MATDTRDEWSETEREIMEATYEVLLEYGYAGLSISRIADEFGKTKSSLYYYYDSKDDLLISFLDFALDRFETGIETEAGDDPAKALDHIVEVLLPLQLGDEEYRVQTVITELRAQAVRNDTFRDQFSLIDERLVDTLSGIIERGIEDGTFEDVESARVAEFIVATINGTMTDRVTTNREAAPATVRLALSSYIDSELRRSQ